MANPDVDGRPLPLTPRDQELILGKSPLDSLWSDCYALFSTRRWFAERLRELNEEWAAEHAPFDLGVGGDQTGTVEVVFPEKGASDEPGI